LPRSTAIQTSRPTTIPREDGPRAVESAKLNLGYTTIKAPGDGIISQIPMFNVGQYVAGGTAIVSLVETDDTWVEANFKETQLGDIQVGQPATVVVDTYGGTVLHGTVSSIPGGDRGDVLADPGAERHGQLGEGRAAHPGQDHLQGRSRSVDGERHERHGDGGYRQDDARQDAWSLTDPGAGLSPPRPASLFDWRPIDGQGTTSLFRACNHRAASRPAHRRSDAGHRDGRCSTPRSPIVALPHMAASLGAAQNEITWVPELPISSAAAIATPLTGWLSDRIGQKRLFILAVTGFTTASVLCGIATSLDEMVIFRVRRAFAVPLSRRLRRAPC